jgi:hypothetical protein
MRQRSACPRVPARTRALARSAGRVRPDDLVRIERARAFLLEFIVYRWM